MSGDLFEILVALAIIVFGLLGSGRKKKRPPARQEPPGARRGPSAERRAPASMSGPASAPSTPAPSGRDELFSEIERILRGQVPAEEPVSPPRAPEPEEAYSLESLDGEALEIDAEKRHQEFHQKYVTRPARGPLPPATVVPRAVARLRRIPLRQAVMWREILGPPKGLQ